MRFTNIILGFEGVKYLWTVKAGAVEKRSWAGQIEQPVAVAWVSQDRATKLGLGIRQLMAVWVSLTWVWAAASRSRLSLSFLFFFSFFLHFRIFRLVLVLESSTLVFIFSFIFLFFTFFFNVSWALAWVASWAGRLDHGDGWAIEVRGNQPKTKGGPELKTKGGLSLFFFLGKFYMLIFFFFGLRWGPSPLRPLLGSVPEC